MIDDTSVASLTLEIYFDMTKLEYLNKTENANFSQNRVIYTWVASNGIAKEDKTNEIAKFTFKAIQDGTASIVVTGDFYNANGDKIEIPDSSMQVEIGKIEVDDETGEQSENQVSDDNSNLKIMRVSKEGISPEFQKDIKEYYLLVDSSLKSLDITAIPENSNSTVTITGNTNLKEGLNTVEIQVQSKDKTKTSIYKIYVTKTNNPELANANLENLAVSQAMLYPPFDRNITKYSIELANDVYNLELLAIPEKINAKVQILGNDTLKIGSNVIEIVVTAENGITTKKYTLTAYRRNEEEEIKSQEEQKNQAEQLTAIIENTTPKEQENVTKEESEKKENKSNNKVIYVVFTVIIGLSALIGIFIYYYKKEKIKV